MSAVTYSNVRTGRPVQERFWPITFVNDDGSVSATTVPINWDELYHLKGMLLTFVDATFVDPVQRKAQKDLVWHTMREWMVNLEARGEDAPPTISTPIVRQAEG